MTSRLIPASLGIPEKPCSPYQCVRIRLAHLGRDNQTAKYTSIGRGGRAAEFAEYNPQPFRNLTLLSLLFALAD